MDTICCPFRRDRGRSRTAQVRKGDAAERLARSELWQHLVPRALVERVVRTTGELVWVAAERDLDAVTALSGSGPAYVFYFLEAMRDAGARMGLPADTALQLAVGTFVGAATLAQRSGEPPQVLRERVTSKGGTTYAALQSMEASGVAAAFEAAMRAAEQRAHELGNEFGT